MYKHNIRIFLNALSKEWGVTSQSNTFSIGIFMVAEDSEGGVILYWGKYRIKTAPSRF